MSRRLRIAEAKQADLVALTRAELQARGAKFQEQTHSRTLFHGLAAPGSFRRGGYLGVFQAMGAKDCEVLVEVSATAPRRAFWAIAGLELVAVVLLLVASPSSAVFFLATLVLWPLLGLAGLVCYLTFRGSRDVEDELTAALTERVRSAGLRVLGEEDILELEIRQRLEGEAAERDLAARGPPPGRFGRREKPPKAAKPPKPEKAAKPAKERKPLFGARKD